MLVISMGSIFVISLRTRLLYWLVCLVFSAMNWLTSEGSLLLAKCYCIFNAILFSPAPKDLDSHHKIWLFRFSDNLQNYILIVTKFTLKCEWLAQVQANIINFPVILHKKEGFDMIKTNEYGILAKNCLLLLILINLAAVKKKVAAKLCKIIRINFALLFLFVVVCDNQGDRFPDK